VNFIDGKGKVCELVYEDGSGWGFTNLTGAAKGSGSVPAAGKHRWLRNHHLRTGAKLVKLPRSIMVKH